MGWPSVAAAMAVGETMGAASAMARFLMKGVDAARRVIFTVVASTASTLATPFSAASSPNTNEA